MPLPTVSDIDWSQFVINLGDTTTFITKFEAYLAARNTTNGEQDVLLQAMVDWANTPEDTLIPAVSGGNEVDDYSFVHWFAKTVAEKVAAEAAKAAAESWAITPEDTPVPVSAGGDGVTDFSALHHRLKAAIANGIDDNVTGLLTTYSSTKIEQGLVDSKGATAAQAANIVINSFNIAVNGGLTVQAMVDGVSDIFTDQSGVDTGRSSTSLYSSVGKLYYPQDVVGFDLSLSEGYIGTSFATAEDTQMQDIVFSDDGYKFFLVGSSNANVYEYTCSEPYDLSSTVAYSGNSASTTDETTSPRSVIFNEDGTKFFVGHSAAKTLLEYTVATGFDLSSAVAYSGNSVATDDGASNAYANGVATNSDGTKWFVADSVTDTIYEYSLSTGFDLSSTWAYTGNSFYVGSQATGPEGIVFNSDGTKFFIACDLTDAIYEYSCSVGFDLGSTVTYSGSSIGVSSEAADISGLAFDPSGTKLSVVDSSNDDVFVYELGVSAAIDGGALFTVTNAALAEPDEAYVVIHQEDIDTVTINTDLTAWVSRTSVATYTTNAASDNKLHITAHGFSNDDRVILSTPTGDNFPTGLDGITPYYVVNAATNDFEVSLTSGGAAVAITADNGGTQNVTDYSQAVLSEEAVLSAGRILTGTADLTSQASGTDIHTVLLTDNLNMMKIHALSTQWS